MLLLDNASFRPRMHIADAIAVPTHEMIRVAFRAKRTHIFRCAVRIRCGVCTVATRARHVSKRALVYLGGRTTRSPVSRMQLPACERASGGTRDVFRAEQTFRVASVVRLWALADCEWVSSCAH